jgi:hypothetical protein
VAIGTLRGDALANAIMKCETKAKRRLTLSLCGLGMLDESEIETVTDAHTVDVDPETGEVLAAASPAPAIPPHEGLEEINALIARLRVRWVQLKTPPTLQRKQWAQHVTDAPFLAADGATIDGLWALLQSLGVSR